MALPEEDFPFPETFNDQDEQQEDEQQEEQKQEQHETRESKKVA